MILSARFVKRANPDRLIFCDDCQGGIVTPHIRLYGMPEEYEKPYTIRLHIDCAESNIDISQEPKLEKALAIANGPQSVFAP